MNISFDLNLDHAYAETLRQQHEAREAQELITELEDKIGSALNLVFERHQVLPGLGDRVEVDSDWMVVNARSFGQDGSVWLSVKPFETPAR
ncbi:hypothetical protein [Hymenobacter algoricola]|uniref:Uncharacterized protein n=1 Tax=Hymenobacter algoricola TaxID=486267 RepID=A0ABP7NE30_9BACT